MTKMDWNAIIKFHLKEGAFFEIVEYENNLKKILKKCKKHVDKQLETW